MEIGYFLKARKLQARYSIRTGRFRYTSPFSFDIQKENIIQIEIVEMGERTITINCDTAIEVSELYSILVNVERFLQILDGAFANLDNLSIQGDEDEQKYRSFVHHLTAHRLKYFVSDKIYSIHSDRFVNYEDILSDTLYKQWENLLDELGVVNQMYLYASSDCDLTSDVKCAFLVELAESLVEIIGKDNIKTQRKPQEHGNLKLCLRALIYNFGEVLFEREIEFDLEKILQCLVNTRVNIMHIKMNRREPYFNGAESVLYSIKMNYLYRFVILSKMGVRKELYIKNLEKRVEDLNRWNGICDGLLERLK